MASTSAPLEIIDQIIDHLHADRNALGACGLVCRDWLPCSRFHLFESVHLHSNNALTFITLTDSPDCTLIPYVRDLDLAEGRGHSPYDKKWLNNGLPRLKAFPVRSLSLHELMWDTLYTESHLALLSTFPHLERLEISYCGFGSFDQLVGLLYAWPQLKGLRCFAITCKVTTPSRRKCPLSFLQELDIDGGHVPQLLPWLLTSYPLPRLTDIKFGCVLDARESRSINDFLTILGSSVTRMQLGFGIESRDQVGDFGCVRCYSLMNVTDN